MKFKTSCLAHLHKCTGRATALPLGLVAVSALAKYLRFFYVKGKALSGELSCTRTVLVFLHYSYLSWEFDLIRQMFSQEIHGRQFLVCQRNFTKQCQTRRLKTNI